MSHSKYLLGSLLLFFCLNLSAQNDSIDYLIPFYIEDAIGNKDTVYAGGSRYAEAGYNPQLGEINLFDVPFDSVLEVRLVRAVEIFDYNNQPPVCSKKLVTRFDDFGTPGDCSIAMEAFTIVINTKYPPITVRWEQELFEEGAPLFCSQGTYLANSMVPYSVPFGNWYGNPGFDAACLAHEANSQVFYPWGGTFPGGPFDRDFVLYPVEGSANELDSLQILLGYFNFSNSEPCATYINSTYSPAAVAEAFQLYPNPSRDRVYLDVDAGIEFREIEVVSLTGRTVYHATVYNQMGIDVSELPPGVYVLRYQTARGGMGSQRFVKQ